jgi:pimeloyl-ACP methyl ester carboxylesterase
LGHARRVIRYDRLGCGLSERERPPETMSIDYEADLLGALMDELELDGVSLFGSSCGGPTAIAYAARNLDRVERVVLYGASGSQRSSQTPSWSSSTATRTHPGTAMSTSLPARSHPSSARRRPRHPCLPVMRRN